MWWFKECPKCNGDLVSGADAHGAYVTCIQCSKYFYDHVTTERLPDPKKRNGVDSPYNTSQAKRDARLEKNYADVIPLRKQGKGPQEISKLTGRNYELLRKQIHTIDDFLSRQEVNVGAST